MDELEALQAHSQKVMGDQVVAMLRKWSPNIDRIANADPATWTPTDIEIIRATLQGVLGLIYDRRL